MKKRLISFLLALSLTLTLLPAASAAKKTVTALHMTGFQTPVVGMKASDITPAITEDVEIADAYWFCNTDGRTMKPTDVFEKGKTYEYCVLIEAETETYEILLFSSPSLFVNGSTELVSSYYSHAGDLFEFSTKEVEAVLPTVTALHMTGYHTPVVGQKAGDITPAITEDVEITVSRWFCDTDSEWLVSTDVFEAEKKYSYFFELESDSYKFSESVDLFVNGSTDLVDTFYSGGDDETFAIWTKSVEAITRVTHTALHVTDYLPPVIGWKAGDVMPAVAEDVEIVDSYWWCDTDGVKMSADSVFKVGKEYSCFIKLLANTDFYEISEEAECYLNGSTDLVDTDITHRDGDVFYFWTKPVEAAEKPTLTALHMTGWQTPVVGMKAGDVTPTITENVEIYDGFWYCDTDGDEMDSADVFEVGKSYSYCLGMWIETENYVISPSASLFVNGSTELVDTFYSGGDDETFAIWTKSVELEKTTFTSIHITGWQFPVVGMKAGDITPTVIEDVKIVDSYWWCETAGKKMAAGDTFQANKVYDWYVKLDASTVSYEISEEAVFYLNGSTELIDANHTYRSGDNFFFWTKPVTAKKALGELHLTGFTAPVVGQKVSDAALPTVTEDVGIADTRWYCDTDDEYLDDDDDVFEAGKSYSLGITIPTEGATYKFPSTVNFYVNGSDDLVDARYSTRNDIVITLWTKPVEAVSASGKTGDVDLDSDVSASDLTKLARHVANIETLKDAQAKQNADVDGDSDIDADDLTALARIVAKI